MKLFCSNGVAERQHVYVTIDGLNAPVLSENYTEIKMDNGTYEVTVWWTKGNCAPDDVEYNLTLTNTFSKDTLNNVTKQTQMTLYLNQGTKYVIAVTAQLCDGDLKSETSNELPLYISDTPTITPGTTMTSNPTTSTTAAVVGGTVSGVLVAGGIVLCIIGLCFRKKIARMVLLWVSKEEVDSSLKRSGIGALYVDTEHIYYSCTEESVETKKREKKYKLRKCTYDRKLVKDFRCDSFVRGIGQNQGFIYVLYSKPDSHLVKLTKDLKFVKKTPNKYCKDFCEAFGMLVTSENVLVCARRNSYICVLDLNFESCYNLSLKKFGPIGIAQFKNQYIITGEGAIAVIDIDFDKKILKNVIIFESMKKGGDSVLFDSNIAFRGICCSDEYIYVTQNEVGDRPGLPILCLKLDEEKRELNYVCEVSDFSKNCDDCNKRCGPVVAFYHENGGNGEIFYCQGSFDEKFHIVRAVHHPGSPIISNKMFDVY
jgi:hypothetical protein